MSADAPTVSVILPVRNGDPYLARAIDSILSQEGVDLELVVIDDGSTDGTAALLAGIADPRLRVVPGPGTGLVDALNLALAQARGTYIARMDADDVALPGRLARQLAILQADPTVDMVHGAVRVIDADDRITGAIAAQSALPAQRAAILLGEAPGMPIIHPTVMYRRESIAKAGGYRHSPSCEDHELWLRVVDEWKIVAIPDPVLDYRQHDGGISREKAAEQLVSNLTNSIAYRYRRLSGIDLAIRAPERIDWLRARIAECDGAFIRAFCLARVVRRRLRERDLRAAISGLVRLVSTGRPGLLLNGRAQRGVVAVQHARLAEFIARWPPSDTSG